MDSFRLFLYIFLGIVGMGYCWSGKRHGNSRLWMSGLALGAFPYFVDNTLLLFLIGIILAAIPFVFRGD